MLTTKLAGLVKRQAPVADGVKGMKVKLLRGIVINGGTKNAGQTVTVDKAVGERLIRRGKATAVKAATKAKAKK